MGYYTGGDYYMAGGFLDFAGPALSFLQNLGKKSSGTPVSPITGGLSKSLGLPFTSVEQVRASSPAGLALEMGGRRRRRMNPLNPRALRRAYTRLNSASRWAHRLFSVSKPRHGVRPKFGRRKRR